MGAKSRGNFRVEWCNETKCLNRDKRCGVCFRKSELKRGKNDKVQVK